MHSADCVLNRHGARARRTAQRSPPSVTPFAMNHIGLILVIDPRNAIVMKWARSEDSRQNATSAADRHERKHRELTEKRRRTRPRAHTLPIRPSGGPHAERS